LLVVGVKWNPYLTLGRDSEQKKTDISEKYEQPLIFIAIMCAMEKLENSSEEHSLEATVAWKQGIDGSESFFKKMGDYATIEHVPLPSIDLRFSKRGQSGDFLR